MQIFSCDYTGDKILPYWPIQTDEEGDFLSLGMDKDRLEFLLSEQSDLLKIFQFFYKKVVDIGFYLPRLYFSDLYPPVVDKKGRVIQAFPYQDIFWDEDEGAVVKNWELVVPEKHHYSKLYLKHNPNVLVGVVETIHYNEPSLIEDLFRCRLLGFSYLYLPSNYFMDAGYYFITRHLVILRPGDVVSFNAAFWRQGAKHYFPGVQVSYENIRAALSVYSEE